MNFDDLKNELNNPSFKLDKSQLALHNISANLYSSYYLREILRIQIELLELHKGKTGTELEDSVDKKMTNLSEEFQKWHDIDLIENIRDFTSDE
jgi:hypothetical protein